jgi:ParB-like chromosome segregation protein Spo0J
MTTYHPACLALPMMSDAELNDLTANIKAHGLLEPIARMPNGDILDGRCRLFACERAEIEPRFDTYKGNDPEGFVLAKNIHRRHLSTSQKAVAAAKLSKLSHGSNQYQKKEDDVDDIIHSHTQERLAQIAGISRVTVGFAKRVLEKGTPNIIKMVDDGELNVKHAAEVVEHYNQNAQANMTTAEAIKRGKELVARYPSNQKRAAAKQKPAPTPAPERELDRPMLTLGRLPTGDEIGHPPPGAPWSEISKWRDKVGAKVVLHSLDILQLHKDRMAVSEMATALYVLLEHTPTAVDFWDGIDRLYAHVRKPDSDQPGEREDYPKAARRGEKAIDEALDGVLDKLLELKRLRAERKKPKLTMVKT